MSLMISPEYLEQNRQLHCIPTYGAGGAQYIGTIKDICLSFGLYDVLDYGCGKGCLKQLLDAMPYEIVTHNYDPVTFPDKPDPASLVVCTDVLEHVEPEYLDAVLGDIHRLARVAAFLVVATRPARKTLPDGRNAHLIQQPSDWWLSRLNYRTTVLSSEKEELKVLCFKEER
ncbi:MAG: methyltransferase domain-containing protein [Gammaproteobacteria bacterium]